MKKNNTIYGLIISILFLCGSCNKGRNNVVAEGVATIQVGLADSEFEGVENVNFASVKRESLVQEDQHTYVPIGDGYSLSVVLSEDNPSNPSNQNGQTNTILKKAVVERTPLGNNIRYKLLVFRSSGEYVLERDYRRGQESTATALLLDGGVAYTFVAYSVNSTTDLPAIVFSDPANRTLATGSLQNVSASSTNYLMHYMATVTPEGGRTTNLAVVLVHKFSQVNATVDATALGLNITELDASVNSHYPTASMTLRGIVTLTGAVGTKSFNYQNLGTRRVVSDPLLVNTQTSNALFVIRNITIGNISRSNINVRNLEVLRGRKYNLTIRVNPTDIYFSDATTGIPVARIAGMVWARHNLGVNTSLDPDDSSPNTSALVGNYYQWGVRNPVANGDTSSEAIANWNTRVLSPGNSWNTGTETNPVRNAANDPCPTGFRVPTTREFNSLIASTDSRSNNVDWTSSTTNYRSMKVLVSLVNENIRLSLPATGYRYDVNGVLSNRGSEGRYYSSLFLSDGTNVNILRIRQSTIAEIFTNSRGYGENIRCIRIQN